MVRASKRGNSFKLVALILVISLPGLIAAQNSDLVVDLQPGEARLVPGVGATVHIALHNQSSENSYHQLRLEWTAPPGLEIEVEGPAAARVGPAGSVHWVMHISQASAGLITDKIYLQIFFSGSASNEGPSSSGVLLSEFSVAAEAPGQLLSLATKTTLSSLSEQRPGLVYLIAKNTSSAAAVQVDAVRPIGPRFLSFEMEEAISWAILPGNSLILPIEVQASSEVQPGKHLVLFDVAYSYAYGESVITQSASVSHEIDVGVFGETEILDKLAAVPSFLLLPGFLMIATFNLLWNQLKPAEEKGKHPLKINTEDYWVVSIFLSLLTAVAYPRLTSFVLGQRRDFLAAYGFSDFLYVWTFSLFLGAAFFLVSSAYQQFQFRRKVPSPSDTPYQILRKMAISGVSLRPVQVNYTQEEKTDTGYLLEPLEQDKTEYWICPRAAISWSEDYDQGAYDQIETAMKERRSPSELAEFLRPQTWGAKGIVSFAWLGGAIFNRPTRIEVDPKQVGKPANFIEFRD